MKNFKTITLGMMCLFGLSVMAIEPNEATEQKNDVKETAVEQISCGDVYTVCDNASPVDYDHFRLYMERNGCG